MRFQRTWIGAAALTAIVGMLGGCADEPPSPYMSAPPMWGPAPAPMPVVRVYEEAPLVQPETVFIDAAPPPMLVEVMPARPSADAVWIGGYWGWRSRWVWCTGRWAPPPRPGYVWMNPYYENRAGVVVFVSGFWRAPNVVFAPPPPHLRMPVRSAMGGGVPPMGPPGTFVPPPPGARPGLVVPAPMGTPPGVVRGAPPAANGGVHVRPGASQDERDAVDGRQAPGRLPWTVVAPPSAAGGARPNQGNVPMQPRADEGSPWVRAPAPGVAVERQGRPWGGAAGLPRGTAQPAAPVTVPSEARSPTEVRRVDPQPRPQVAQPEGRSASGQSFGARAARAPSPGSEASPQGSAARTERRDAGADKGGDRPSERRTWGNRKKDEQQ